MKILVLGATGMLGQAIMEQARLRGIEALGAARKNSDIILDVSDTSVLSSTLREVKPNVVINTVADVNLAACENHPGLAYTVNARPAAILAKQAQEMGTYFIQISTDHYYVGDMPFQHREEEHVQIINEYARTKYAGEQFTLTCPGALVIRTNIVGFRGKKQAPTFVEWIINSLKSHEEITLFNDYYTSSIDTLHFAGILFDLLDLRPAGVINIASRECFSKKDFIIKVAAALGYSEFPCCEGSVIAASTIPRANNLGLDVSKAEKLLQQNMPDLNQVVASLLRVYTNRQRNDLIVQ